MTIKITRCSHYSLGSRSAIFYDVVDSSVHFDLVSKVEILTGSKFSGFVENVHGHFPVMEYWISSALNHRGKECEKA